MKYGFIEDNPRFLPTLQELKDTCDSSISDEEVPCMQYMMQCVQQNKASSGGCCECLPGWMGRSCDEPMCHPNCMHGTCMAPDLCFCDPGWKGPFCADPICDDPGPCVPSNGVCTDVNHCTCFYGWEGEQCEIPMSGPECVNGK